MKAPDWGARLERSPKAWLGWQRTRDGRAAAGEAFAARLAERKQHRVPLEGPKVATAQITVFAHFASLTCTAIQFVPHIRQGTVP